MTMAMDSRGMRRQDSQRATIVARAGRACAPGGTPVHRLVPREAERSCEAGGQRGLTTMHDPSDLPGLVDPAGSHYWDDIHGTLAPLRERWPVVRSTAGVVEVLRYEHGEPLL